MKKTAGLSHANIQMVLQKIPFFRGERLAAEQDSFVVAQPKELIVLKGSMDRSFYILLSGVVEVMDREGQKPIFELSPGDFFGEIGFLSETSRTANVRAQDICILMRIDQQLMSRLRAEVREKIKDQLIDKLVHRILSQG